ncbi:hypothetical protein [Streptomyces hebeiensis]
MPFIYRCDNCRLASHPHSTEPDAAHDRDRHRAIAHHGLIPEDSITEHPGLIRSVISSVVADLANSTSQRSEQPQHWQQIQKTDYFRQAAILLGAGFVVLVLLSMLFRTGR